MDDLTKSFLKKHELLIKEENKLKEHLQIEVTKSKENLENYLSTSINDIKLSERLKKGIEKMKNKEENIIKLISYVSKANKTQKEMINLSTKLMYNIKFHFDENKNEMEYEKYLFSLPIPENIEVKDITYNSFSIKWNIKDLNIDSNKIKYVIEMKKENDKFQKIYEGNKNEYLINNLTSSTNYDIRICLSYDNNYGEWSSIQKIKTKELSNILKETNQEYEYINKLLEWTKGKNIELIYRGTRDGMNNKAFYNKCSNIGPTIILIKNDKNNIFGGYASISWKLENNDKNYSAPDSFLFTLTNIYNIQPTKFPSKNDGKEIRCYLKNGPLFGNGTDLGLYENFINSGGWTYFGDTYPDILGKGKSIFTGNTDNNQNTFKIKEIEVFKLFK